MSIEYSVILVQQIWILLRRILFVVAVITLILSAYVHQVFLCLTLIYFTMIITISNVKLYNARCTLQIRRIMYLFLPWHLIFRIHSSFRICICTKSQKSNFKLCIPISHRNKFSLEKRSQSVTLEIHVFLCLGICSCLTKWKGSCKW